MAIRALSAGTLKGDSVKNIEGKDIGKVEEIMIELDTGRVAYVVLSTGGLLGLGDKFFALPWSMIAVDLENQEVVADIDKETIDNAPGFDKDEWPDPTDLAWLNEVYDYYDAEPFWAATNQ